MPLTLSKIANSGKVDFKEGSVFQFSIASNFNVSTDGQRIYFSAKAKADSNDFSLSISDINVVGSGLTNGTINSVAEQISATFFPDASTGGGGGSIGNATETAAGIAELLTTLEAEGGLDDQRIATILKVGQWFNKNWAAIIDDGDEITQEIFAKTSDDTLKGFISWNRYRTQIGNLSSGSNQTITFDPNALGLEIFSESIGKFLFDAVNSKIELTDYRAIKKGLEYDFTEYKDLTNNSLVPKGFLKNTQSPVYGSDFQEATALNGLITGGSGATYTYTDREAGRLGILSINRGTTAANRGRVGFGTSAGNLDFFALGGKYGFQVFSEIKVPVLSNATDRFLSALWFNSANDGTDGANALGFKIQDNINSGKVQIISRKASVTIATIDTGITVLSDTWLELCIKVNAAGSLAEFFINGSKVGEVTGSANMPNGTGQAMGLQLGLYGLLGTADRALKADNLFLTTI